MKSKLISIFGICLLSIQGITVFAQDSENLSPIETVEWSGQTEQTQNSEKETKEVPIEEEGGETSLKELSISTPKELMAMINDENLNTASDYFFVSIVGEDVVVQAKGAIQLNEIGKFTYQTPPLLPENILLKVDENQQLHQYLSLDDYVNYVADAINAYPEEYAGSPMEDFYIFAQEHHEDLSGKFVEINDENIEKYYLEYKEVDAFLKDVFSQYMEQYGETIEYQKEENLDVILLKGKLADNLNQIIKDTAPNYANLGEISKILESPIEGTISFNYETQEIGIGLLSEVSEGESYGIEYYMQAAVEEINLPTEENIMTKDVFVELVGYDPLAKIKEYNTTIDLGKLQPLEESNE